MSRGMSKKESKKEKNEITARRFINVCVVYTRVSKGVSRECAGRKTGSRDKFVYSYVYIVLKLFSSLAFCVRYIRADANKNRGG